MSQLDFVTNVELEKERLRKEREEEIELQLMQMERSSEISAKNTPETPTDKAVKENKDKEDNNNYRGN